MLISEFRLLRQVVDFRFRRLRGFQGCFPVRGIRWDPEIDFRLRGFRCVKTDDPFMPLVLGSRFPPPPTRGTKCVAIRHARDAEYAQRWSGSVRRSAPLLREIGMCDGGGRPLPDYDSVALQPSGSETLELSFPQCFLGASLPLNTAM